MITSKPTIVKCNIGPYSRTISMGHPNYKPSVRVQLDTGEELTLFDFYPDEVSFTEAEFIGLTLDSAKRLKFEKDIRHIQSYMKTN